MKFFRQRKAEKAAESYVGEVRGITDFYEQTLKIMAAKKAAEIDTRAAMYCTNVYLDIDNTIHTLPFIGGIGLWRFDGQIFYRYPKSIRRKVRNG